MDDCANAQYPPITEAIRSRVESGWDPWPEAREWLLGKCDTIDAVHAELERENERLRKKVKDQSAQLSEVQNALERRNEGELKPRWQKELNRLKAERDSMAAALDAAQGEHDFAPESHYVMLPKDADGVPIHVGDWITGRWNAKAKVVAVTSDDVYWWEPDGCHWCHAFEVRHYHAPTVEDVLREFVAEFNRDDSELCDEEIIERFAAKLRLAGDAE